MCVDAKAALTSTGNTTQPTQRSHALTLTLLPLCMRTLLTLFFTGGNVERAADWLFSHMDDLPAAIAAVKGGGGGGAGGGDAAAAGGDPAGGSR